MYWLWLSSDFRLDPHKYCIPLQIHLLWGCNSKYPAASPKPSADFFWAWTGPMTFSDRLGQMQSLKELGQQRVVNERNTDLQGKIWTSGYFATSWFLINKWCSRRKTCINTCWEAAVTRRGTALGIITWSQYSGAHIKAEHAGDTFFFFSFAFHTTDEQPAQLNSLSWLPPRECRASGAELAGQHVCRIRASVKSSLAGPVYLPWYGHKLQTILFPISWEGKPSKNGWIFDLK